ncbi:hypothetical protein C0J52_14750 [Blattella germanica]|nr:hypothetical protein C0J52_14750 [Blattella germanica]
MLETLSYEEGLAAEAVESQIHKERTNSVIENIKRLVNWTLSNSLHMKLIITYIKPRTVNITTAPGPLSAGKTHQLQCMTTGSAPPARVTWLLDGESIRDAVVSAAEMPNSTTSVLTFRPRAGDDGKELACRAENKRFLGGMLEDRRRLDVTCK